MTRASYAPLKNARSMRRVARRTPGAATEASARPKPTPTDVAKVRSTGKRRVKDSANSAFAASASSASSTTKPLRTSR